MQSMHRCQPFSLHAAHVLQDASRYGIEVSTHPPICRWSMASTAIDCSGTHGKSFLSLYAASSADEMLVGSMAESHCCRTCSSHKHWQSASTEKMPSQDKPVSTAANGHRHQSRVTSDTWTAAGDCRAVLCRAVMQQLGGSMQDAVHDEVAQKCSISAAREIPCSQAPGEIYELL